MAPIGSVIKNTLVYVVIMGIAIFVSVQFFLFNGLVQLIKYAGGDNNDAGSTAIMGVFLGLLIIFVGLGLAINLSLPSIVGDEMVEF